MTKMLTTTPSPAPIPGSLRGLTADSRRVEPGFLFAALPGSQADGRDFINDAIAKGAVAVLAPTGTRLAEQHANISLIEDDNPRRRFALMAAAYYRKQPEYIAAVTGTNGKTSTADFARQLCQSQGMAAASVGTLGIAAPGMDRYGALTTPDPVTLHEILAELAEKGISHLAMEASSHGLDQYRLDGVRVGAAGFTNLSRDHLDYHATVADYLAAKTRLFTEVLAPEGIAVINVDTDAGRAVSQSASEANRIVFSYGRNASDIRLVDRTALPHGQTLKLSLAGQSATCTLPLIGGFQAMNALCAAGLVLALGGDRDATLAGLEVLRGVRGRLELAATLPNGAAIYVDYAHTPDALETVLTAVRPHVEGRLFTVFGCGGDRDPGKRPQMGAVVQRLADRPIVTDDNPRTEDPAAIRAAVMAACPDGLEIGDRAEAIRAGVNALDQGDVLVIAGKGHEPGQIVGDEVRPFDDVEQARKAANALVSRAGS
ncbi:MAG: UDP-N-acetylmuramoyl-L-alanyl-D-glutamate--2,6-diaminopimelate ligase [Pseudomonadota bacterium]